jgi:hypothetical protein
MAQGTILIWVFAPLVIYLCFFLLARRPTAIRISRVGQIITFLIAATWLAAMVFPKLLSPPDWLPVLVCLGLGLVLWSLRRIWFVRLSTADYMDLATSASGRLLLPSSQSKPHEMTLESRTRKEVIRVFPLTPRLLVTRLPSLKPRDKITLLVCWLGKVLPGPLPRIKIVLKRK